LWNRQAIIDLIKSLFCFKMPTRTAGEYLKRWGYTPQKPIRKAYEQQPKKFKDGLIRNIRKLKSVPKSKMQRFSGAMRLALTVQMLVAESMRQKAKHQLYMVQPSVLA
jgi:hypothetical protein